MRTSIRILVMRRVNNISYNSALIIIILIVVIVKYEYIDANDKADIISSSSSYEISKSICNIDAIQMIQLSDLVFTGKIEFLKLLQYEYNTSTNNDRSVKEILAIVRVKRIIKANVKYFKYVISGYRMSIKLSLQFFDHIDRIFANSSRNCIVNYNLDNVRINDTKIFYGKSVDEKTDGNGKWLKDGDGEGSRQHVLIAVPDVAFEREILKRISNLQNTPDPCRNHVCQYGARCAPINGGRNAACECPSNCPNYGDHSKSKPICGSDGLNYANHCELNKAACVTSTNISVKYEGYCDPCVDIGIKCIEPEVCQLDSNRYPVCRCSEICSTMTEFAPVCGSDGNTYSNECALRQRSCRSKKTIRIIYRGKCDLGVNPCVNEDCKYNEECVINKFGIATCECVFDCESIVRPVCGSDGLTYDSICHLLQSSCQLKNNVSVAYNGVCNKVSIDRGLCVNFHCDWGARCVPVNDQPNCECPECVNEFDPVCGSDGISYDSTCKLQKESCRRQKNISVKYKGLCSKNEINGCENKECEYYAICENDNNGEAKCICPSECPREESSVCGSDNNTYSNECQLKRQSCLIQEWINISHKGECSYECHGVNCHNRTRCETSACICNTSTNADCDKDRSNSFINEPVCASDMNTYRNECEMQKYACDRSLNSLTILFYGDCKERIDASLLLEPVKKSDLSESSEEQTLLAPYKKKDVCADVRCDYGGSCEVGTDGLPRCSCIFDCTQESEKMVCGSDFHTYSSLCHMRLKSCQKQEEIRLRPIELCRGLEVKPCNGKMPIVDPVTRQELDCGNGANRKDCPPNSYCHHTSKFAKCCLKDNGIVAKSCRDSWYGCCPDNQTQAQGPNFLGCSSSCNCNKLGSQSSTCDQITGQCKCKPGVGGIKCDRCESSFWGLPKISSGHPGCLPCGCSLFGSVRDDCEQMTGRCVCKPEIQGAKCTVCSDPNKILGPNGCTFANISTPSPTSCDALNCYFNATCEMHNGMAKCVCHISCPNDYSIQSQPVCGNDGQTYNSECQLKLYACRYQKDIAVQALSSCTDDYISGTDGPRIGASTSVSQFTEAAEHNGVSFSKSTRHVSSESRNMLHLTPNVLPEDTRFNGDIAGQSKESLYTIFIKPTQATIITAIIDDYCNSDEECSVENSYCAFGICVCKETFSKSVDRLACIESISLAITQKGCASNPCRNGTRCVDKENGKFECSICSPEYNKWAECENLKHEFKIEVPAFNGQSFIKLKQLKAYHKFGVEIEFKSYTENGILLYSQQRTDGTGDFVSLALVNGFIEFRYNLGNGPAILTSIQRITLNVYHKVVAKRYQRDGVLQVDDEELVAGQSGGTLKALDLNNSSFVGYIPDSTNKIFENIGTSIGFIGCIRKLKIGRIVIKMNEKSVGNFIEEAHGVKECADFANCNNTRTTDSCSCPGRSCETESNPCVSNPCQLGSVCEPLLQGGFQCNCLPGHKGNYCEIFEPTANDYYIPEFNGINSYLKFSTLENIRRRFSIEIWFLTDFPNGVLLYNGQMHNRRGDFISINLVDGHAQFRYNLGSGMANITTENKIRSDIVWQSIKIHRFDRLGSIQLNNGSIFRGISGSPLNELNLELPLFVGGVSAFSEVSSESGIEENFKGAIQRILVNGKPLQLLSGEHANVVPFKGHICASEQTCLNGGACVPFMSSFLCKCMANFEGTHCQYYISSTDTDENDEDKGIRFNGNIFLQYKQNTQYPAETYVSFGINGVQGEGILVDDNYDDLNDGDEDDTAAEIEYLEDDKIVYHDSTDFDDFFNQKKNKKFVQYEFSIRTIQTNGLLLWSSRIRRKQRDYLAVAIIDGFIEFSCFLGSEQKIISVKSAEIISDGMWHSVWIQHRRRTTRIRIDSNKFTEIQNEHIRKMITNSGKLFIGGIPNLGSLVNFPLKVQIGFQGCLKKLIVDRQRISVVNLTQNTSAHIRFCEDNSI